MEKKLTEKEIAEKVKERVKGSTIVPEEVVRQVMQENMRENNQNLPWEVLPWQEHVADDVLGIAIAIQKRGAEKHNVNIGIDVAVQAASVAYGSGHASKYRATEGFHGEPVSGVPDAVLAEHKRKVSAVKKLAEVTG